MLIELDFLSKWYQIKLKWRKLTFPPELEHFNESYVNHMWAIAVHKVHWPIEIIYAREFFKVLWTCQHRIIFKAPNVVQVKHEHTYVIALVTLPLKNAYLINLRSIWIYVFFVFNLSNRRTHTFALIFIAKVKSIKIDRKWNLPRLCLAVTEILKHKRKEIFKKSGEKLKRWE